MVSTPGAAGRGCIAAVAASLLFAGGTVMADAPAYRGMVELESALYPVFASNPRQSDQERAFKFRLDASYKANTSLVFGTRAFLRKDAYNDDRDAARLDELWAQYGTPEWDVRIGNQLVTWGSVESVSPLDIINPRDYEEDMVEPVKIGVPAVRVRKRFEDGDFSLYWLPYYKPSRYAGPQSFYSFSGGLPNRYPASERHDGQWAARYFHSGDGFDYGISYFHGLERNAIFTIDPAGDGFTGRAYRAQRIGFDGTRVIGDLVLKGEFVYRTSDEAGNRRALLYVLGTEYTFSSVWRHSDLTLFVEYLASSRNVKDIEQNQNDLFALARWTFSDRYKQQLRAGLSWDLEHRQSHVYRAEYTVSPVENIDAGIRYTYARDYFPGARHAEKKDGVLHLFLRVNF